MIRSIARHSDIPALRTLRRILQICIVAVAVLAAVPALAQDEAGGSDSAAESAEEPEFAEPTLEQQELNDQAVQALTDKNYAKAVSYLQEAIFLGELNVSYLNLGRAYQQMGSCRKAKRALGKVEQAPKVEKPSPAFIRQKTAEYMAELPEKCPSPDAESGEAEEDVSGPPKWPIGVTAGGGFVLAGGALAMFAASTVRSNAENSAAGAPANGYTQTEFVEAEREANMLGAIGVGAAAVGAVAPRSPWLASPGCKNNAGDPVEASVAAILRAI